MFGIEFSELQFLSGSISSVMFITGTMPMIYKAFKTKDLRSYSLGNIALSNLGNLFYWVYVAGLPVGPAWFLHSFNTLSTFFMLLMYLRYERRCAFSNLPGCTKNTFPG